MRAHLRFILHSLFWGMEKKMQNKRTEPRGLAHEGYPKSYMGTTSGEVRLELMGYT